jgi:hypothetical protein
MLCYGHRRPLNSESHLTAKCTVVFVQAGQRKPVYSRSLTSEALCGICGVWSCASPPPPLKPLQTQSTSSLTCINHIDSAGGEQLLLNWIYILGCWTLLLLIYQQLLKSLIEIRLFLLTATLPGFAQNSVEKRQAAVGHKSGNCQPITRKRIIFKRERCLDSLFQRPFGKFKALVFRRLRSCNFNIL